MKTMGIIWEKQDTAYLTTYVFLATTTAISFELAKKIMSTNNSHLNVHTKEMYDAYKVSTSASNSKGAIGPECHYSPNQGNYYLHYHVKYPNDIHGKSHAFFGSVCDLKIKWLWNSNEL